MLFNAMQHNAMQCAHAFSSVQFRFVQFSRRVCILCMYFTWYQYVFYHGFWLYSINSTFLAMVSMLVSYSEQERAVILCCACLAQCFFSLFCVVDGLICALAYICILFRSSLIRSLLCCVLLLLSLSLVLRVLQFVYLFFCALYFVYSSLAQGSCWVFHVAGTVARSQRGVLFFFFCPTHTQQYHCCSS